MSGGMVVRGRVAHSISSEGGGGFVEVARWRLEPSGFKHGISCDSVYVGAATDGIRSFNSSPRHSTDTSTTPWALCYRPDGALFINGFQEASSGAAGSAKGNGAPIQQESLEGYTPSDVLCIKISAKLCTAKVYKNEKCICRISGIPRACLEGASIRAFAQFTPPPPREGRSPPLRPSCGIPTRGLSPPSATPHLTLAVPDAGGDRFDSPRFQKARICVTLLRSCATDPLDGAPQATNGDLPGTAGVGAHHHLAGNAGVDRRRGGFQEKLEGMERKIMESHDEGICRVRSGAAAAPEGAVTLVFTDVQSSTEFWEVAPDAMREALSLHNDLLRRLIKKWHGYEVKTEGDSFMIAFASPAHALRWAAEAQTSLLKLPWPEGILAADQHPPVSPTSPNANTEASAVSELFRGLRVRMGLHSGSPDCRRDPVTGRMDYFGPMVNLGARVSGAARGGEILLSHSAHSALRVSGAIPDPETSIKPMGVKFLKGILKPEPMYSALPAPLAERATVWEAAEAASPSLVSVLSPRECPSSATGSPAGSAGGGGGAAAAAGKPSFPGLITSPSLQSFPDFSPRNMQQQQQQGVAGRGGAVRTQITLESIVSGWSRRVRVDAVKRRQLAACGMQIRALRREGVRREGLLQAQEMALMAQHDTLPDSRARAGVFPKGGGGGDAAPAPQPTTAAVVFPSEAVRNQVVQELQGAAQLCCGAAVPPSDSAEGGGAPCSDSQSNGATPSSSSSLLSPLCSGQPAVPAAAASVRTTAFFAFWSPERAAQFATAAHAILRRHLCSRCCRSESTPCPTPVILSIASGSAAQPSGTASAQQQQGDFPGDMLSLFFRDIAGCPAARGAWQAAEKVRHAVEAAGPCGTATCETACLVVADASLLPCLTEAGAQRGVGCCAALPTATPASLDWTVSGVFRASAGSTLTASLGGPAGVASSDSAAASPSLAFSFTPAAEGDALPKKFIIRTVLSGAAVGAAGAGSATSSASSSPAWSAAGSPVHAIQSARHSPAQGRDADFRGSPTRLLQRMKSAPPVGHPGEECDEDDEELTAIHRARLSPHGALGLPPRTPPQGPEAEGRRARQAALAAAAAQQQQPSPRGSPIPTLTLPAGDPQGCGVPSHLPCDFAALVGNRRMTEAVRLAECLRRKERYVEVLQTREEAKRAEFATELRARDERIEYLEGQLIGKGRAQALAQAPLPTPPPAAALEQRLHRKDEEIRHLTDQLHVLMSLAVPDHRIAGYNPSAAAAAAARWSGQNLPQQQQQQPPQPEPLHAGIVLTAPPASSPEAVPYSAVVSAEIASAAPRAPPAEEGGGGSEGEAPGAAASAGSSSSATAAAVTPQGSGGGSGSHPRRASVVVAASCARHAAAHSLNHTYAPSSRGHADGAALSPAGRGRLAGSTSLCLSGTAGSLDVVLCRDAATPGQPPGAALEKVLGEKQKEVTAFKRRYEEVFEESLRKQRRIEQLMNALEGYDTLLDGGAGREALTSPSATPLPKQAASGGTKPPADGGRISPPPLREASPTSAAARDNSPCRSDASAQSSSAGVSRVSSSSSSTGVPRRGGPCLQAAAPSARLPYQGSAGNLLAPPPQAESPVHRAALQPVVKRGSRQHQRQVQTASAKRASLDLGNSLSVRTFQDLGSLPIDAVIASDLEGLTLSIPRLEPLQGVRGGGAEGSADGSQRGGQPDRRASGSRQGGGSPAGEKGVAVSASIRNTRRLSLGEIRLCDRTPSLSGSEAESPKEHTHAVVGCAPEGSGGGGGGGGGGDTPQAVEAEGKIGSPLGGRLGQMGSLMARRSRVLTSLKAVSAGQAGAAGGEERAGVSEGSGVVVPAVARPAVLKGIALRGAMQQQQQGGAAEGSPAAAATPTSSGSGSPQHASGLGAGARGNRRPTLSPKVQGGSSGVPRSDVTRQIRSRGFRDRPSP